MAKPRLLGMKSSYIPNSKADMRFKRKVYQRGREITERDPGESRAARREMKQHERMKADACRSTQ